jgi:hypothetical protein
MKTHAELDTMFKTKTSKEIKQSIIELSNVKKDKALYGKSVLLINIVVDCLVDLRDKKHLDVSLSTYNDNLSLERIFYLSEHHKIPIEYIFMVKNYLRSLPGFDDKKNYFEQNNMVKDQHARIEKSVKINL